MSQTTLASRVKRRNHGRSHSYYLLNEDGTESKLDGVTTLIGEGLPKPALVGWAGNVTAAYAVDHWAELGSMPPSLKLDTLKKARYADVDQAAKKGTAIHDLAEKLAHGYEVEVPDDIRGHVESAARFLDEYAVEIILTETTVYNVSAGYAGTLDLVFKSSHPRLAGKIVLGDWKTSRSGIYDEAALQLSAYQYAELFQDIDGQDSPVTDLGITAAVGIWIRADGYDVYPLDTSERTFEHFRRIAAVARIARLIKDNPLKGAAFEAVTA